jgi:hypothetical protein
MGCWSIFPWQTDGVEVAQRHQEILQAIEKQEAGHKEDCVEPRARTRWLSMNLGKADGQVTMPEKLCSFVLIPSDSIPNLPL